MNPRAGGPQIGWPGMVVAVALVVFVVAALMLRASH